LFACRLAVIPATAARERSSGFFVIMLDIDRVFSADDLAFEQVNLIVPAEAAAP